MKRLSYWASQHVVATRLLILGCYVIANVLGWGWALLLHSANIHPSPYLLLALLIIATAALLVHPVRTQKQEYSHSYVRRKAHDLVICTVYICLIALVTVNLWRSDNAPLYASIRNPRTQSSSEQTTNPPAETQHHSSNFRDFLNAAHDSYQEMDPGVQILLVILSIVVTVAFCIGWAVLCCSIACNGAGALAIILGILGIGGAITGCVFLCRRIISGPRRGRNRYSGY